MGKWNRTSVSLEFEGYFNKSVVGCLDFKKLLDVNIDIVGTKEGGEIGFHPAVSKDGSMNAKVEVAVEKEKTIITIISDHGNESAKLHIGNDYWKHNSLDRLIARYKSYKLLWTNVQWQMEKNNFTTVYL